MLLAGSWPMDSENLIQACLDLMFIAFEGPQDINGNVASVVIID